MKILIDLTSLDDNFSGIERYALNISKQMIIQDNKNNYVLVFKNKIHEEFQKFSERKNVELKVIAGNNRLIFNQIILPSKLYRIKADKYLFLAFPSPILFFRKGIINTIHDLTCWDYPKTMKFLSKWYFRISISNAMKCSERILTVSNFSKDRISQRFNNKKNIDVIYNGVSEVFENFQFNELINESVKKKYNLPENYIMSLGTLEPRKNLKLLIKAFVELKKEGVLDKKLVLVGRKGWKFDYILSEIQSEILEDIIFTGFVEDKDLPYVYKNAELFVFPSIYEGFGIPLLEAAKMEVKIITSNIDVFNEIFKYNNISFKSDNVEDLKSKILIINNYDENKNIKIINKFKKLAEQYSWQKEAYRLMEKISKE